MYILILSLTNRHCPNCQTGKKLKWIEARKEEVLNIKYYHVVFTIPSEIYLIALQNQEKMYKILFQASAETLQELARDEKYLGRYTHRVAISNERILEVTEDTVTFKWRDYKDNNKMKEMTISIEEFIR